MAYLKAILTRLKKPLYGLVRSHCKRESDRREEFYSMQRFVKEAIREKLEKDVAGKSAKKCN